MRRLQIPCEGDNFSIIDGEIYFPQFENCGRNKFLRVETCKRPISIVSETPFTDPRGENWIIQDLKCGHRRLVKPEAAIEHESRNVLWENLLPFQKEFVEACEANNCRFILRDEMGLGKTPQSLSVLRENAEKFTDGFTKYCLIITPTGGIYQWEEEAQKWLGLNNPTSIEHMMLKPQVIVTTGQHLTPISKVIICPWSKIGDKFIQKQIKEIGLASIIVDECHFFKDERSARTKNLLELTKLIGPKAPLILMSGTLTENRIMEMKVPLNLMDPMFFSSWDVLDRFCIHSDNGKALTLNPRSRERFFDRTHPYMMGRKKAEVNIPLPKLERNSVWVDPSQYQANEDFALAYNRTLDELEKILETPGLSATCLIGLMQQLRHYTGKMKILSAAIWIDNWFTGHPGEKLAVGIHHIQVREALAAILQHRKPLQMSDEDPKIKDQIEKDFRNGKSNLLICSIMSAGVGRNFQFCKNAIVLERQWNRSKEDQFEQRFHRIIADSKGRIKTDFTDSDTVNITYIQAVNSFDEYFDKLVHLKGIIVDSSDESVEELPDDNFIVELAREIVTTRQKWVGA